MAHEILAAKLCELDESLGRLHSRVRLSEEAGHERLQQEIQRLERECAVEENALHENLRRSKSELTPVLEQSYLRVESILRQARCRMRAMAAECPNPEYAVEEQLLLAEYALDFAHRAADRALLISMEAIDAQLSTQKEGES